MKIQSYKKDGKTYYKFNAYIRKDENGKEIRTNRQGFKTKKDAEIEFLRLKERGLTKNSKLTFKDAYEEWLESYSLTVRTSTLCQTKLLYKNHILEKFGNLDISNITPQMLQTFINELSAKISKISVVKSIIKRTLDLQVRNGVIESNPADNVLLPKSGSTKREDTEEENFYSKEELQRFLNLAREQMPFRFYVFFYVLAFTGMRRGEALALLKTDIDFAKKQISITKTMSRDESSGKIINNTKTSEGNRIIDIDDSTLKLIQELMNENTHNDILFTDKNYNYIHLSTPIKHLNKLVNDNHLKRITVHGFRHTHCSLLFEAGASLKEVQHRLGHKDIKTTMDVYTHLTKNQKLETIEKFISFINKK